VCAASRVSRAVERRAALRLEHQRLVGGLHIFEGLRHCGGCAEDRDDDTREDGRTYTLIEPLTFHVCLLRLPRDERIGCTDVCCLFLHRLVAN
jgi:hypothetical protein